MVRVAEADQVRDAVHQHRGLPAARTGQQKKRALGREHSLPLYVIQFAKALLDVLFAQLYKACFQLFVHVTSQYVVYSDIV